MSKIGEAIAALRGARAMQRDLGDLKRELMRLSPQVAAMEARIEELRLALEPSGTLEGAEEQAEARSMLDEMRREHAQVRARISAATVFEERLRVVEERLGD